MALKPVRSLRQSRALKAQKSRSVVKTLPAPTGGWNARDALSAMPPEDAVALVNYFPQTTDVILRYGSEVWGSLTGSANSGNAMLLSNPVSGDGPGASTPDTATISIAGDIDIRLRLNLDDWVPALFHTVASKTVTTSPQRAWYLGVNTNGRLLFMWSPDGLAENVVSSTVATGFADGTIQWIRVTFDVDNGAGQNVVTFYTSTNGDFWTQLGAAVTTAGTASIFDNTAALVWGSFPFSALAVTGKIYTGQLRNGIGGTLAASFSGADANVGATSVTSSLTGEVYTLTENASIIYDAAAATGAAPVSNQVETLMAYVSGSTNRLFAINSGSIWNVTTQNAATIVSTVTLAGSRWNHINIATSGGNFLYMVNIDGLDSPYTYDGTTWSKPAITGVTTANLVNINAHKNRVWFIEKDTLRAWYLPTASIAGAVASLDLSAFFTRGGKLIAMATWTIDAGYGVDDLAVFMTSKGEVAVYRGTDPSSSTTWALVGIYWIGEPIGMRPHIKFSGDCLVITDDGIVPLSGALQSSRTNPRVAISDKIQSATASAADLYGSNFGWQMIPFPRQNMLLVNVPVSEGTTQEQYVMNTITQAWGRFTGWNANCWELFNEDIYFGGTDRTVMRAWSGTSDASVAIEGAALQAFNYFGSSGQQKRFPMLRPVFLATGAIPLSCRLNIDFDQNIVNTDFSNTAVVNGAVWDSAVWDIDTWQNEFVQSTGWRGGNGVGFCAAPEIGIRTANIHAKWVATDVVIEPGAIL